MSRDNENRLDDRSTRQHGASQQDRNNTTLRILAVERLCRPARYVEALERARERNPFVRLYALVDGLQFQLSFGTVVPAGTALSLFDGTPDAPLAHAGPWLEMSEPVISSLIASMGQDGLAQLLQLKLDATLPDGRTALVRFYDPRVLHRLATILTPDQRASFFQHIDSWHFVARGHYFL